MCDDCSAEGARCVGGAVLCQCPQTGFTEDVAAGMTHVWAEIHVQTHRTDVTFSVSGPPVLFILAAAATAAAVGWIPC